MCDISKNEELAWGCDDAPDILNSLRLVPNFNEKEVVTFFNLFERIADTRGWGYSDDSFAEVLINRERSGGFFLTEGEVSVTIMPKLRLHY